MATRDDILIELGLAPVWQRRSTPGDAISAATAPTTVEPAIARGKAERVPPALAAENAATRRVRIGALPWDALAPDIAACTACALCRTRTRTVPGVGDAAADWLFVGEAPGADEDVQGEPFVGQAGKLLDAMLAALGMARGANVYIANVLKCRPPANRTPEPQEVESCRPYLDRQIALIKPKLIVALGKSAATTLLGTESSIASLRGRLHRYGGIPLVVTYHPAYLLRTLADKAKAWEDLLLARRTIQAAGRPEGIS
ncbi:MAG: uracil-DNA glycosylase [Betaproteobacteria bacterium]